MFDILFTLVPILVFCVFAFVISMMFSPKMRSWFMGKQIKAQKHLLDDNAKIIRDLGKTAGSLSVNMKKDIYDENGDTLRDLAEKDAELSAIKAKKLSRAIKDGLKDEMFCKHCGSTIDRDSKFCKECGKEQ